MNDDELRLFSAEPRNDRSHSGLSESTYAFLDRVDQPYWSRVRSEIERWFAAYPGGGARRDLRGRFCQDDEGQHRAAWWELYLHALFQALGYDVEVHPSTAVGGTPDFRITKCGRTALVEALAVFSGIDDGEAHSRLEPVILDLIDKARHDDFTVSVDFEQIGTNMPRRGEVVAPILRWLDSLDPDVALGATGALPQRTFAARDWRLGVVAYPNPPDSRGNASGGLLSGQGGAGNVNDVEKLRDALDRKVRHYGTPDEPLVFAALLISTFADQRSIENALFGDTALRYYMREPGKADPPAPRWVRLNNGLWTRDSGPRAQWVSGVITGRRLHAASIATEWPRLWPNPWATLPLDLPLPVHRIGEDPSPAENPADLFGLPSNWPGPEPPFTAED